MMNHHLSRWTKDILLYIFQEIKMSTLNNISEKLKNFYKISETTNNFNSYQKFKKFSVKKLILNKQRNFYFQEYIK